MKMPLEFGKNSIESVAKSGHYRHFDNINALMRDLMISFHTFGSLIFLINVL